MKHLKSFENNVLKKYFIADILDTYGIFEKISIAGDILEMNLLYFISDNVIKKNDSPNYEKSYKMILNKKLYTSDNLEDCMEKLPVIGSIKKYNI